MTSPCRKALAPALSGRSQTSQMFLKRLKGTLQSKVAASLTRRATLLASAYIQTEEAIRTQTMSALHCTSAAVKMTPWWNGRLKTGNSPLLSWTRTLMQNWECPRQEVWPQVSLSNCVNVELLLPISNGLHAAMRKVPDVFKMFNILFRPYYKNIAWKLHTLKLHYNVSVSFFFILKKKKPHRVVACQIAASFTFPPSPELASELRRPLNPINPNLWAVHLPFTNLEIMNSGKFHALDI